MQSQSNVKTSNAAGWRALVVGFLLGNCISANAVLNIPNLPIFIANDVQANIFFALDDSGSMDLDVTLSNGALNAHPGDPDFIYQDLSPNRASHDRAHCAGYNINAYDPTVTYTPWGGVDSAGNPYQDQSVNNAALNPFNAGGSTNNLLRVDGTELPAGYGTWTDTNGDDVYQDGECPVSTAPAGFHPTLDFCPNFCGYSVRFYFLGAAALTTQFPGFTPLSPDLRWISVGSVTPAEQTNYANWYAYYRKREYIMKRAVSDLINDSSQRMGLATLQNNNNVGTAVADMTDPAAKSALLNQLFSIGSGGLTPLRDLLANTGEYFDQTDGNNNLHSPLGFTTSSPILSQEDGGECQQNFTLLFSDGAWNGGTPTGIGERDGDGSSAFDGGPHADSVQDTLADIAMKYYETDLSTLDNKVPVITNVDENTAQHLVTYAVAFGVDGTLTDADTPADHDAATPSPPWPSPFSGDTNFTRIDDMRHAGFNARGLFLSGQKPQELIDTLNAVISDIGTRIGTAAAVATTAQSIQTDTLIFQGSFDTANFDGELTAFQLNSDGTIGSTVWIASPVIPAENNRKIFTAPDSAGPSGGVEFEFANLSAVQMALLGGFAPGDPGNPGGLLVDYIRGDQTSEVQNGGTFRDRNKLLGDIIHSAPVAVTQQQSTPPYQLFPGSEGSTFVHPFLAAKAGRQDMVYVGANDGMMHGFRTDTGAEEFAYVPEVTFPNLAELTNTNYSHRFYVDGTLSAADAYVSGNWKTVLVGAPGRGGNALFALDVSAPTTFDKDDVLWEFTNDELGAVLGKIQIARLHNGAWAAITGNGYNSTSETAQLFVIDLATGVIIKQFDTGEGSAANSNGLSTPLVVDTDADLIHDFVYAGDLLGNLWKFDLTDPDPANWAIAFSGIPLYTALAPSGNPQPITSKPAIVTHPDAGFILLFGTGRFFVSGDDILSADPEVDTFYGIWDNNITVASVGARDLPSGTQPETILQPQAIIEEDTELFGTEERFTRTLSNNAVEYTTPPIQFGWYLDLVSPVNGKQGERVIADPVVTVSEGNSPLIVFNTFAPTGGCETAGGFSALMALDPINGGRTNFAVFDLNGDDAFTADDADSGSGAHDSGLITGSTIAPVALISSTDGTVTYALTAALSGQTNVTAIQGSALNLGRQSWRELQ